MTEYISPKELPHRRLFHITHTFNETGKRKRHHIFYLQTYHLGYGSLQPSPK